MPVDRTWYNLLVDDDGTGLTGTAIDKDDFNQLINAIDSVNTPSLSWTPALAFGGATTGITYGTRVGNLTRLENVIILEAQITLTSKGTATGAASMGGSPYTASLRSISNLSYSALAGLTGNPKAVIIGASIFFVQSGATADAALDNTHFTNTSSFYFSLCFRT